MTNHYMIIFLTGSRSKVEDLEPISYAIDRVNNFVFKKLFLFRIQKCTVSCYVLIFMNSTESEKRKREIKVWLSKYKTINWS